MLCDICGVRDAVVKVTQVVDQGKTLVQLCERCAAERGVETTVSLSKNPLGEFLLDLQKQTSPTSVENVRCTFCNATLRDFRATGRLGCGRCYSAFESNLRDLLRRVHGRLQRDSAAGRVKKEYLAIVRGTPAPPRGSIEAALARSSADRRQVVIGMVMTRSGIPLCHHVFAGNTVDKATVSAVVQDLKQRFGLQRVIFVGDRGMLSDANMGMILGEELGFIVAHPLRKNAYATEVIGKLKSAFAGEKADDISVPERAPQPSRVLVVSSSQFVTNPFAYAGNGPELGGQFAMFGAVGGDPQLQMIAGPYAQRYLTNTILSRTYGIGGLDFRPEDALSRFWTTLLYGTPGR